METSPYAHFLTMYQSSASQRGVGVLPKRHINFMECEVMRFYKLQTKGIVEPIAMTVPRKVITFCIVNKCEMKLNVASIGIVNH